MSICDGGQNINAKLVMLHKNDKSDKISSLQNVHCSQPLDLHICCFFSDVFFCKNRKFCHKNLHWFFHTSRIYHYVHLGFLPNFQISF